MKGLVETFGVFGAMIAMLAIVFFIVPLILMWVWNAVVPELFGLPYLTFWKALGLYVICGILFKNNNAAKSS